MCYKCADGQNAAVVTVVVLVVVGVLAALLWFNLSESVRYKFAAAMIGLNALQISAMYGKLELDWGPVAAMYFDLASFLNLNFELTSPECSLAAGVDAWVLKWALALVLPLLLGGVLLGVALVYGVLIQVRAGWFASKTHSQLVGAYGRTMFQCLVLMYLPLTDAALAPFGCRRDSSGRWVLDADPARSCYTREWWMGLFGPGMAAVMVYAVTVPVAVVGVLNRAARQLDELTFVVRFNFLVGRFARSAWWFEAAIMVRKLMVAICMTFFFSEENKANAAVFALVASLGQLLLAQPYASVTNNVMAVVVLASTATVLYAGTFDDYLMRRLLVNVGIVVNLLAIVVGNAIDAWLMTRTEKRTEAEEYYVPGVVQMDCLDTDVDAADTRTMTTTELGINGVDEDGDLPRLHVAELGSSRWSAASGELATETMLPGSGSTACSTGSLPPPAPPAHPSLDSGAMAESRPA